MQVINSTTYPAVAALFPALLPVLIPVLIRQLATGFTTVFMALGLIVTGLMATSFTATGALANTDSEADANEMLGIKVIQAETLAYMRDREAGSPGTRVEYQAAPMDSRLNMRSCNQPLAFEPQTGNARSGRTLVKVRCDDSKPWAMFVPLTVERWQTVVTARNSIQRNAVITTADIELQEQKLLGPVTDYARQTDAVIGLQSRRAIEAGAAINTRLLVQPKLIKRGDEVVIIANSMGVSAKMPGTAMADGRKNQQIQVRNQSSKRMIKARVIAPGTVEVIM